MRNHFLYTTAEIRQLEQLAINAGMSAATLMQSAGRASYDWLRERWPQARSVVIFCGTGNNGGDGFVLAQIAHEQGLSVDVRYLGDLLHLTGEAKNAMRQCQGAGVDMRSFSSDENISDSTVIANYACGKDYHIVVRERLKQLAEYIQKQTDLLTYKIFVDTAPVLEKSLAQQAGLGWIGKNTLIMHKNMGSFVILGEIFIDVELLADTPAKNHCGDCTKCLDACPTNALVSDNQLDARRCISYLTIEYRG